MHRVERVYDAAVINCAVNLPEVLPQVARGYEDFDLTEFVTDKRNVALRAGEAFAIFAHKGAGVYEGHYLFPASVRGPRAKEAARAMICHMFTRVGASAIHGHIPRSHRAARALTYALGFAFVGKSLNVDNEVCAHYVLEKDKWAAF